MLLLILLAGAGHAERSRGSFDFDWRFHLGNLTAAWTGASPSDPTYDDSTWRLLNVPHDFVIEGEFNISLDPNHGALARSTGWYRKNFTVPSDLEGSLVWLQFDGVYRSADIFVNGAFVTHHEEGYTSFIVYIHNGSEPLRYGAENVIAVFVDGTQSELWAYEGARIALRLCKS
jgi:beta-galactosidase